MGTGTHDRGGKSQTNGVSDIHVEIAKQILMAISPRRMFSKIVDSNQGPSGGTLEIQKGTIQEICTGSSHCLFRLY
jgi:hypothetical protein